MIPKTDDKRVLFAVPWLNKVVIGTTDTPVDEILEEPLVLEDEVDYILEHINRYVSPAIRSCFNFYLFLQGYDRWYVQRKERVRLYCLGTIPSWYLPVGW